jgi:hypothetical protein
VARSEAANLLSIVLDREAHRRGRTRHRAGGFSTGREARFDVVIADVVLGRRVLAAPRWCGLRRVRRGTTRAWLTISVGTPAR